MVPFLQFVKTVIKIAIKNSDSKTWEDQKTHHPENKYVMETSTKFN